MASLEGVALGETVARAQRITKEILPATMSLRLAGDAEAMKESGQRFMLGPSCYAIWPRSEKQIHGRKSRTLLDPLHVFFSSTMISR